MIGPETPEQTGKEQGGKEGKWPISVMFLGVLVAASFWTLWLPGAVAYHDGVFSYSDLAAKVEHTTGAPLDPQGLSPPSQDDAPSRKTSGRVTLAPFATNVKKYAYFVSYLFLIPLAWSFRQQAIRWPAALARGSWVAAAIALLVQLPHQWSLGILNAATDGRRIYSYVHSEFSQISFWLDQGRSVVIFFLVGVFCAYEEVRSREAREAITLWRQQDLAVGADLDLLRKASSSVTRIFDEWQLRSLVLAGAFLPFTLFFWFYIAAKEDTRYVFQGLIFHIIWGGLWCQVTYPLLISLAAWKDLKLRLLIRRLGGERDKSNGSGANTEDFRAVLTEAEPISNLRLVALGTTSFASFVLPLLNLLK